MMTEMKGLTRKESPCHPHGEDVCQASSAHGEKKRQECPPTPCWNWNLIAPKDPFAPLWILIEGPHSMSGFEY